MLKVIRIESNAFVTMSHSHAIYRDKVGTIAILNELGVDWKDIEDCLVDLEMNDNQVGYFGALKTYLYSKRLQTNKNCIA